MIDISNPPESVSAPSSLVVLPSSPPLPPPLSLSPPMANFPVRPYPFLPGPAAIEHGPNHRLACNMIVVDDPPRTMISLLLSP